VARLSIFRLFGIGLTRLVGGSIGCLRGSPLGGEPFTLVTVELRDGPIATFTSFLNVTHY
jgi:hypothetical protein